MENGNSSLNPFLGDSEVAKNSGKSVKLDIPYASKQNIFYLEGRKADLRDGVAAILLKLSYSEDVAGVVIKTNFRRTLK